MIRAVFFDLDGTLLDRRLTFRLFLESQARSVSGLGTVPQAVYVARALELDRSGNAPRVGLFAELAEELGLPAETGAELYEDFRVRFPERCVPFAGVAEALGALRRMELGIGLITNGSEVIQRRKIERLGIGGALDTVVISESVGLQKPDPAIFELAMARLGFGAAESVFVGDNPETDVLGATGAGMIAVWHRDDGFEPPIRADATIERIDELPAVIERLGTSG